MAKGINLQGRKTPWPPMRHIPCAKKHPDTYAMILGVAFMQLGSRRSLKLKTFILQGRATLKHTR